MSPAQDLDIWFLLECWGLYLTLRFLLVWVLRKDSALPLLKTLFLLLFLILCPKSILPLCYRKEAVYVIFDRRMKKLTKIKVFRSSSWGEYISAAFRTPLASTHFIYKALSQRSCPHTPQQNGVAERKHRHILETARSLLLSASVPSKFLAEAVSPASTHGLRRWWLLAGQERGYQIACLRWALFTTYNRSVTEETESLNP